MAISFKKLMRYRGWKVWQIHDMHVCLLTVFYILITDNLFMPFNSLILISSLGFYFMFGFLINDFFDLPTDIAAGKKRVIQELSRRAFIGIILIIIFISVLHLLYLNVLSYIIIYSFSYILATLYSAPLIGFKRRALTGIIVNALIEKGLPVLAIFFFFHHFALDSLIFTSTAFILQIIEILTHQIYDYEADIRTRTNTFVVSIGKERALRILNIIVMFSIIFITLLCILICIKVYYAIFIVIAVFISYSFIFLFVLKGRLSTEESVFPLYLSPFYFLINNAFPLFLALVLSVKHLLNSIFLLIALYSQYYLLKKILKLTKEKVITRTEIEDSGEE